MAINTDKTFLGTGWAFPPEFDKHAPETTVVSEEEDIRESLHILIFTSPGERVMHPTYGCGLRDMVFDSITESTITELKDTIEQAILFFEPRITLQTIEVDTEKAYDGLLEIQLDYTVRTTNSRSNMVFPFYRHEGTHLNQQLL